MQYSGGASTSASRSTSVSSSTRVGSWPRNDGVTNRSIAIAASLPASAAPTPVMPSSVSTSTRVSTTFVWFSPRIHAGRNSPSSGRSTTRLRMRVISIPQPWIAPPNVNAPLKNRDMIR